MKNKILKIFFKGAVWHTSLFNESICAFVAALFAVDAAAVPLGPLAAGLGCGGFAAAVVPLEDGVFGGPVARLAGPEGLAVIAKYRYFTIIFNCFDILM